ncbi:MAG: aminotransferase class V-fold PLP-dependent enzyme [Bacteroidota bacterium]
MKLKLLSPGPVPIPDFVQAALGKEVIHHRDKAFEKFHQELLNRFRFIFQTEKGVCSCIGSGTYGVEMAIYSLFRAGEEVLVPVQGKFSERWAAYGQHLGLKIHQLPISWGQSPDVEEIMQAWEKNPATKGIILTHSETSTGALLDLEEIAFQLKSKNPDFLILVDGITSIGSLPYYHDAWGIDCSVIASQKALMNPAGLVAFAFSERGRSCLRESQRADFQNLYNHLKAADNCSTAYTPPVQLLFGVDAAITYMQKEGYPAIWHRVQQTARYFREEIKKLGGLIFPDDPSDSLSSFSFPGRDHQELKKSLEERHALLLSGGQGELKGKILRVSHMGLLDRADMEEVIEAIKKEIS